MPTIIAIAVIATIWFSWPVIVVKRRTILDPKLRQNADAEAEQ